MRVVPALAALVVPALLVPAQASSVEPDQPRQGQRLAFGYDGAAKGARLRAGDGVKAVLWVALPGGHTQKVALDLPASGDRCRAEWTPPPDTIGVTVHFLSLDPERPFDPGASKSVVFRLPDGALPRGAAALRIDQAETWSAVEQLVAAERERFPDSLAVYREKWFRAKFPDLAPPDAKAPDLKNIVERDVRDVEAFAKQHGETDEALYALASGYTELDRKDEAGRALQRLIEKFPGSAWCGLAMSHWDYAVYTMPAGAAKTEAAALARRLLDQMVRDNLRDDYVREKTFNTLATDAAVPLALIDRVCAAWLEQWPEAPMALDAMARARLTRNVELERATELARAEANSLLAGRLRLSTDISNQIGSMILAEAFELLGRIALARGQYADAIAAATAAQTVAGRSDAEPHALEASAWEAVGDRRRAERALARALLLGDAKAESELRRIYLLRTGSADGFGDHLAELTAASAAGDRPAAPAFAGKTLDGAAVSLADLRGKVVVLNFWHTGCAPCIAEMPALNTLVQSFQGADVAFLGVTFETAEATRSFLQKHGFDYRHVVDAQDVATDYRVKGYPTHVVIDRQGRIAYTRLGGSEVIDRVLRGVIEAALR